MTVLAMMSSHGSAPVSVKSNASPPEKDEKLSTLIQSRNNPPMSVKTPPPIMSQSDVLNLLKSMWTPS
jgi:hypothetical protein